MVQRSGPFFSRFISVKDWIRRNGGPTPGVEGLKKRPGPLDHDRSLPGRVLVRRVRGCRVGKGAGTAYPGVQLHRASCPPPHLEADRNTVGTALRFALRRGLSARLAPLPTLRIS